MNRNDIKIMKMQTLKQNIPDDAQFFLKLTLF